MTKQAKTAAVPKGYRSITATIATTDVQAAVRFYADVFGASVAEIIVIPGTEVVLHARIKIGDTQLILSLDHSATALSAGGNLSLHHYLDEIEAAYEAALTAGATVISQPTPVWWGDLNAVIVDPFGIRWNLAKRVENVSADERSRRLNEIFVPAEPVAALEPALEPEVEVADQAA